MLGALAVGAAFGYGAQRGAFCMSSGFRGVIEGESPTGTSCSCWVCRPEAGSRRAGTDL